MHHCLLLFLWASSLIPSPEGAAYRQPQLAMAQGQVAMVFGGGSTIYYAGSPDGGQTFQEPVPVTKVGALALGRHRGPRVAILPGSIVISAIAGERAGTGPHAHGLPEAGDLLVWRSTDKGRTWQQAGPINDVPGAAREGLHAMSADTKGRLFVVWLDLRGKGTRLYGSRSTDGGATWSKNALVYESPDGTICQCCHPSLVIDASNRIHVMWRNVVDGSRDLHITSSSDGIRFERARRLGSGTWKINACPMDGGGFAVQGSRITSAWRRESEVILASADGAEKRLGSGKDVALAQTAKGIYVAWTKGTGLEYIAPGKDEPAPLSAEGAFVSLLALPGGSVLAAWESKQGIVTRRLE